MSLKEEIKERLVKKRPTRVFSYIHGEGRIGVLLEVEADTDFCLRNDLTVDFAKETMLQIASMNPQFCTEEEATSDSDYDYAKESFLMEVWKKPVEIQNKIVAGKMNKWLKENTLMLQPWVRDNSIIMQHLLSELSKEMGEDVKVINFSRFGE